MKSLTRSVFSAAAGPLLTSVLIGFVAAVSTFAPAPRAQAATIINTYALSEGSPAASSMDLVASCGFNTLGGSCSDFADARAVFSVNLFDSSLGRLDVVQVDSSIVVRNTQRLKRNATVSYFNDIIATASLIWDDPTSPLGRDADTLAGSRHTTNVSNYTGLGFATEVLTKTVTDTQIGSTELNTTFYTDSEMLTRFQTDTSMIAQFNTANTLVLNSSPLGCLDLINVATGADTCSFKSETTEIFGDIRNLSNGKIVEAASSFTRIYYNYTPWDDLPPEERPDFQATVVPLPAGFPLLLGGIGILAALARRRRN